MIKSSLYKLFQVAVILAVGQIQVGRSTVGGEFVDFSRNLWLRASKSIPETATEVGEKISREVSSKEIISKEKLDGWKQMLKKEDITEEESEAVKSLLKED
jgi:hypothetical protein